MKAVVLRGAEDMVITDVPDPTPGENDVIIRISHCGICGSDLHFWDTGPFEDTMIMGHEFSGTIAAVGSSVTGWAEGQRVNAIAGAPCGTCFYCRQGDTHLCDYSEGIGMGQAPGGYAEFVCLPAETLIPMPDHVSFQEAATVEPLSNGLHCVRKSTFQPGDGACVIGAGPIGLSVVVWLRRLGAGTIVVSEPAEGRRAVAKAMGADHVVDPRTENLEEVLRDVFDGVGPALAYECVGRPETIQDAFLQVRKGGEVVIMGICFEPTLINPILMVMRESRVRACYATTKPEMEETLAAIADGSLTTEGYVTDEIGLGDVPGMFTRLHTPNAEVKVLIEHAT